MHVVLPVSKKKTSLPVSAEFPSCDAPRIRSRGRSRDLFQPGTVFASVFASSQTAFSGLQYRLPCSEKWLPNPRNGLCDEK